MHVRRARVADAAAIAAIYNRGIEDRVGTFETGLRTAAMVSSWFDDIHPIVKQEVGVYEKHGQLDGVWRDVVIVEYLFATSL